MGVPMMDDTRLGIGADSDQETIRLLEAKLAATARTLELERASAVKAQADWRATCDEQLARLAKAEDCTAELRARFRDAIGRWGCTAEKLDKEVSRRVAAEAKLAAVTEVADDPHAYGDVVDLARAINAALARSD
jgi:hypothetical protein